MKAYLHKPSTSDSPSSATPVRQAQRAMSPPPSQGLLSLARIATALPQQSLQLVTVPDLERGALQRISLPGGDGVIQRALLTTGFNLAGEQHNESGKRRQSEVAFMASEGNTGTYWSEPAYKPGGSYADPPALRAHHFLTWAVEQYDLFKANLTMTDEDLDAELALIEVDDSDSASQSGSHSTDLVEAVDPLPPPPPDPFGNGMPLDFYESALGFILGYLKDSLTEFGRMPQLSNSMTQKKKMITEARLQLGVVLLFLPRAYTGHHETVQMVLKAYSEFEFMMRALKILGGDMDPKNAREARSMNMHLYSRLAMLSGDKGLWKVGDDHIKDIVNHTPDPWGGVTYKLITQDQFNHDYEAWLAEQ